MEARKLKVGVGSRLGVPRAPPKTFIFFFFLNQFFVLVGVCRPLLHPAHSCRRVCLKVRGLFFAGLTPVSGMENSPWLRVSHSLWAVLGLLAQTQRADTLVYSSMRAGQRGSLAVLQRPWVLEA